MLMAGFCYTHRQSLKSTLFPYTTLFRSGAERGSRRRGNPGAVLLPEEPWLRELPGLLFCPAHVVRGPGPGKIVALERSEEHTSELQSRPHLVCRLLLEKKNQGPCTRSSH